MADVVQTFLEESIPELEDLQRLRLFSKVKKTFLFFFDSIFIYKIRLKLKLLLKNDMILNIY